jgi:hypothetical protein
VSHDGVFLEMPTLIRMIGQWKLSFLKQFLRGFHR